MTKNGYTTFGDIAMLYYGIPDWYRGIFSVVPLVSYGGTLPFKSATGS